MSAMMEILDLSWRAFPAAVLALVGVGLIASGLRLAAQAAARRGRSAPEWAMLYLQVFRRIVVGLALVAVAAGWIWQVPWLFAAGVCIGVGELLESSYYIWVMRWGQRQGILLPPPSAAPANARG